MATTFDPDDTWGAYALERLRTEKIAWLTTVTPSGQPLTMPIWFLWVDGEVLVYGDRRARRNANIEANQRVSLHLPANKSGGDILVIEGDARIDPDLPLPPDNPAYLEKYGEWIDTYVGGAVRMAQTYSMQIRIKPTRVLGYAG